MKLYLNLTLARAREIVAACEGTWREARPLEGHWMEAKKTIKELQYWQSSFVYVSFCRIAAGQSARIMRAGRGQIIIVLRGAKKTLAATHIGPPLDHEDPLVTQARIAAVLASVQENPKASPERSTNNLLAGMMPRGNKRKDRP